MADSQDYFEVIENSQYELIQSMREEINNKTQQLLYEVVVTPSKNDVDLNLVENQFYQFEVIKKSGIGQNTSICKVERRFSQFNLIYEILVKKNPGYIFPAFPSNDILAYVKSKVTIVKDETFISRRIKVIERFFQKILNQPGFNPLQNKQLKQFVSTGKEFQVRRQIEKNGQGFLSFLGGKVKNLWVSKQNKYTKEEAIISQLKKQEQFLYNKCVQCIDLLKQQFSENIKMKDFTIQGINCLDQYKDLIAKYDKQQEINLKLLQELEFHLFCENEDLMMVKKMIERINQLKKNEENYNQLKQYQEKFNNEIDYFIVEKKQIRKQYEDKLKSIIRSIQNIAKMAN